MELHLPAQTDCLLLHLDKNTCFYALVFTSLKITRQYALLSCCDWKQDDFSNSEAVKEIPLKTRITVSLFWQIGTIGCHTSLEKSRPYLGNTNMLCKAFYTCPGNLSAAPITICLIVLINHSCEHFIPPLHLPSSLLPCSSLHILLSALHFAHLCFSVSQLFQLEGVIQAWNTSVSAFQRQFFQRSPDNDGNMVCYLFQKQRSCYTSSLHFFLLIFRAVSQYFLQHLLAFWNWTDAAFKYLFSMPEMPSSWV